MRNLSKKAKTIIAGAAIAGLASAGGAYAYWTTTGSGTGQAATGAAGTLSIVGQSTIGGLVPGGYVDVPIVAHNATDTSLQASTLAVVSLTSNKEDCNTLVTQATATPTSPEFAVTVLPGDTDAFGSVRVSLPDSGTENQNDCKGAIYTFVLSAS